MSDTQMRYVISSIISTSVLSIWHYEDSAKKKKKKTVLLLETPKSYLDDSCSWVWVLSCIRLFATPWTVAHQAPLSMGILQARILEWVVLPSSRGFSWPRDWTFISYVSCISRWVLYHSRHLILLYCWEVLWEISLFHFIWLLVSEFLCLQNPTPPPFLAYLFLHDIDYTKGPGVPRH